MGKGKKRGEMKREQKIYKPFIKNQLYHDVPQQNYGRIIYSYLNVIIIIALQCLVN